MASHPRRSSVAPKWGPQIRQWISMHYTNRRRHLVVKAMCSAHDVLEASRSMHSIYVCTKNIATRMIAWCEDVRGDGGTCVHQSAAAVHQVLQTFRMSNQDAKCVSNSYSLRNCNGMTRQNYAPRRRDVCLCTSPPKEIIRARNATDVHVFVTNDGCYYPSWKYSRSALAHCRLLLEKTWDVFSLFSSRTLCPTNSCPVVPAKVQRPAHRARHAQRRRGDNQL